MSLFSHTDMFRSSTFRGALGSLIVQPAFSCGQLYLALPRAGLPHKTKLMIIGIKDRQGNTENSN